MVSIKVRLTEEKVAYESVTRYLVPQGASLVIVYFPSINQRVFRLIQSHGAREVLKHMCQS